MNEKRFILSMAEDICQRKVAKENKDIDKLSSKLAELNDSNSSVRKRAGIRSMLSTTCEERDRWQNRIDIINKWMKEIE